MRDASSRFERIWALYSRQILDGGSKVDVDGPQEPILTLVYRLPEQLATTVHDAVEAVAGDSGHYVYPPSTMHMTVLFLSPYLGVGPHWGDDMPARVARTAEIVEEAFAARPALRFVARGLNVFPTTIFLQLIPQAENGLFELRRALAGRLRQAFPDASPTAYEQTTAWNLAFANVVRFRGPVAPEVVDVVASLREAQFGEVKVSSVELVETDKLLSHERTTRIREFALTHAA